MAAPCGWLVSACDCGTPAWGTYSQAIRDRAEALAAHFLWAATGRRYGPCEVTVVPCNPTPAEPLYQTYGLAPEPEAGPFIFAGTWHDQPCGAGTGCCSTGCEVDLPGPVADIIDVAVAGTVVASDAYVVADHSTLIRTDGLCWPVCNRVGEVPGFEVTYLRGMSVPAAVQYAFEGLACQLAKACAGTGDCALPTRMRSLTRQGVTVEVAAEEATSQGGKMRTGVKWIDDVIAADNPGGLTTAAPRVFSPDLPVPRTVTSIGGS